MRMSVVVCLAAGLAAVATTPDAIGDARPTPPGLRCDPSFKIYFGNGVMNTPTDWVASRQELQAAIGTVHQGVPIKYANAYNPSAGLLHDLRTVFAQKISEDPSLSWRLLASTWLGVASDKGAWRLHKIKDTIRAIEKKSAALRNNALEKSYTYVDAKVIDHVAAFTDDIVTHGKRVLVVGHSQGGLYANAAYRLLHQNPAIKPGSFAVAGVGTAADFVAGNGAYVTSDADMVINALRALVAPSTLAANLSVPLHINDLSGHSFIHTYLNAQYSGRDAVVAMAGAALDKLTGPVLARGDAVAAKELDQSWSYAVCGAPDKALQPLPATGISANLTQPDGAAKAEVSSPQPACAHEWTTPAA